MVWAVLTIIILLVGILAGLDVKKRNHRAGWFILILTMIYALVMIIGVIALWDSPDVDTPEPHYAMVLGYALEDGEAQPELIRRLERALEWMETTEEIPVILSGGDAGRHGVTEASVMYEWMEKNGADMSRIHVEDDALDTEENIRFSKILMGNLGFKNTRVLVITSDYHQTRAQYLVRQNGQQALGISCKTPFGDHLIASIREVYSFTNELLEGFREGFQTRVLVSG